jgi:membrane protease subunit (stomatin/prohibitin family)
MRAIGFHGTSVEAAQRILSTGFEISRNEYDWLGDGAYFFQDAPARALEWALQRFGANAAVIGAEIDLDDCIDLLDIPWEQVILTAFDGFIGELTRAGKPIPRQTAGAHRLDRYVIDYLATRMAADGMLVRSVRAVFPEGKPLFPGSALLSRSHVQIAVRDRSAVIL